MRGRFCQQTAARWTALAVLLSLPLLALVGLAPQAVQGFSLDDRLIVVPADASTTSLSSSQSAALLTDEPSVLLNGWGYTGHKPGHKVPPGQAKKIPESK